MLPAATADADADADVDADADGNGDPAQCQSQLWPWPQSTRVGLQKKEAGQKQEERVSKAITTSS